MQLKYGLNPHQQFASLTAIDEARAPLRLLNGSASYINVLDALNAWQLVHELRGALGLPAAASFKHVSPAGAALAVPLSDELARSYEVADKTLTPLATAYVRARGADPKCSFGDFVALSDEVDEATAEYLKGVVSDGVVAPGYSEQALAILKTKKNGAFIIFQADPAFEPPARETREIWGMKLTQDHNARALTMQDLKEVRCGSLDTDAERDLLLGLITLKYTQSNSVGYAWQGQMIGIGAGQQSRVDCTKLAGTKSDVWHLGRHPKVLGLLFRPELKRQDRINFRVRYIEGDLTKSEQTAFDAALQTPASPLTEAEKRSFLATIRGVSLVSDGFIPFRDNIDHASKHGVSFIAQPGGSSRDADVEAACVEYDMAMVHTHVRLFHH